MMILLLDHGADLLMNFSKVSTNKFSHDLKKRLIVSD